LRRHHQNYLAYDTAFFLQNRAIAPIVNLAPNLISCLNNQIRPLP
jgi:hypothetical protein